MMSQSSVSSSSKWYLFNYSYLHAFKLLGGQELGEDRCSAHRATLGFQTWTVGFSADKPNVLTAESMHCALQDDVPHDYTLTMQTDSRDQELDHGLRLEFPLIGA